jgi:diguanylate cyclase (GGDEF)-like protein
MPPDNVCSELYDQLQAVADSLPAPIFVIDYDGRYVAVFGGRSRDHYDAGHGLVGCYMQEVLPEEKWELYLTIVRKAIDTGTLQVCDYRLDSSEVRVTENDGPAGPQWFHGRVYPVAPRPGKKPAAVWLAINVSEQKLMAERLRKLSEQDDLTGVYNRRYFMKKLENEAEIAHRRGTDLGLVYLDIDHFKAVNDGYGHPDGDRALKHLVATIRPQLRDTDILARIGGEEFALLCPSTAQHEAFGVAERIRSCIIGNPLNTARGPLFLTISLGVTELLAHDTGIEPMLRRADDALYRAKKAGRNCTWSATRPSSRPPDDTAG